jgi:glucose-1-phosphate cytidylyltransferase
MHSYARHGFRRFVLCPGVQSGFCEGAFPQLSSAEYRLHDSEVVVHEHIQEVDWEVALAYIGLNNMTGNRVTQAPRKYLGKEITFAVTYGDGLTDVDLAEELAFHLRHGRTRTVLGVNPPSRFGEMRLDGDVVTEFSEKPEIQAHWINSGFFFFQRDFLSYLSEEEGCVLERDHWCVSPAMERCVYRSPWPLALDGYATRAGAANEDSRCRQDALVR